MPEKFATKEGTEAYFQNHEIGTTKLRQFGDKKISAVACGTYLGASDSEVDRLYEESLVYAAQNGVNFFDTAINYRCQRSERNIAFALRKLAGLGVHRDQVFISTKGGFLPADGDPNDFQNYVLKCFLNTGLIKPEDIVSNCHCMTPDYIQSQIDLSLQNLKIKTIDLYYLHNPEIQLPKLGPLEFYKRIEKVFEVFEKNVSDGKIKSYGLATWNGFRQAIGAEDRIDLEQVIQCAKNVAGDNHHFKAIQLPYNLAMVEAVAIQSQMIGGEQFPIIPAAVHNGLSVFISAPLMQSHVKELPQELYDKMPGKGTNMQKALQFVTSSPGVISAMVGMKSLEHTKENLGVLKMDNWEVQDLQNIARLLVRA